MLARSRKFAVMALGAGAILVMGAVPANAASSEGATFFDRDACRDVGRLYYCYTNDSVGNVINTPSGNSISVGHRTQTNTTAYDFDVFNAEYASSSKLTSHGQSLTKDGKLHVSHSVTARSSVSPDIRCIDRLAEHYANGKQQFIKADEGCL